MLAARFAVSLLVLSQHDLAVILLIPSFVQLACFLQRMLALSEWINWPSKAAVTDLLLADGCRGARLLMQTMAHALVRLYR